MTGVGLSWLAFSIPPPSLVRSPCHWAQREAWRSLWNHSDVHPQRACLVSCKPRVQAAPSPAEAQQLSNHQTTGVAIKTHFCLLFFILFTRSFFFYFLLFDRLNDPRNKNEMKHREASASSTNLYLWCSRSNHPVLEWKWNQFSFYISRFLIRCVSPHKFRAAEVWLLVLYCLSLSLSVPPILSLPPLSASHAKGTQDFSYYLLKKQVSNNTLLKTHWPWISEADTLIITKTQH